MPARGLRRRAASLAVFSLAVVSSGCGSSVGGPVGAAGALPAASGTLVVAVPESARTLDPLAATTPVEQLVVRQVFEPLVEHLSGPYEDLRRVTGPALSVRPSEHGRLWRVRLRPGIRFQDGSRLDAQAVLANVSRWQTTPAGRELLPGLVAADAPRPDLVRLFLDRGDPAFAHRLASVRLGMVSPRALEPAGGEGARLVRDSRAGTGSFEVRQRGATSVVLAANPRWWGMGAGLGPALDSIELRVVGDSAQRARLLTAGEVQMATGLRGAEATRLDRDPLVDVRRDLGGGTVGLERSVRGINAAGGVAVLSGAWLTTIAAG